MNFFRPWGSLDWIQSLAAQKAWSFLGCLGPEERSVAAVRSMNSRGLIAAGKHLLFQVRDWRPQDEAFELQQCQRWAAYCQAEGLCLDSPSFGILDPSEDWLHMFDNRVSDSVVLDISSMPKRFFFLLLRRLLVNESVKNLIITYTTPESYDSGPLSGNPEPWGRIPDFFPDSAGREEDAAKRLVVNMGFMPRGLIEHLQDGPELTVDVILPFPAPSLTVRRTWDAARALVSAMKRKPQFHRVAPPDMPEAFERLLDLSDNGRTPLSLAPFGPKPISAAMCLLAVRADLPVYYSQPKTYSPRYCQGVRDIFGYWVRHEGTDLYCLR